VARQAKKWTTDEWKAALENGEAKRLSDRFTRDAGSAKRQKAALKAEAFRKDPRTDSEKWAAEFAQATSQRSDTEKRAALRIAARIALAEKAALSASAMN
jgi:hypothetical protein